MASLFLQWFFLDAPRVWVRDIKAITTALWEYFSISILIRSLADPWRHDAIDISSLPIRFWWQAFIRNMVSRIIGISLRLAVITIGLTVILTILISGALFIFGWIFLPVLLIAMIIYGLKMIAGGL